jgi:hypothetical protein
MRRTCSLVLAGLAFAVLAAPAAGQVPTRDSVIGSGTLLSTTISFAISVEGGPGGENPTGTVHSTSGATVPNEFDFDGTATCLNVTRALATTGFRLTSGLNTGRGFLVAFGDGGTGATGEDQVLWFQFIETVPTSCPPAGQRPPGAFPAQIPIQPGGVAIVDAPPFPTSRDQCKNGAWKTFGVFKNQGDCVSFVATKRKNPPSGP